MTDMAIIDIYDHQTDTFTEHTAKIIDRETKNGVTTAFLIERNGGQVWVRPETIKRQYIDDWCRSDSCRYRNWRSGSLPTHRRGDGCPDA